MRCADILPGLKDARSSRVFNRERADAVEGMTNGAPPRLQFIHPRDSVDAGIGLSDPTQGPEQRWRRLGSGLRTLVSLRLWNGTTLIWPAAERCTISITAGAYFLSYVGV
ncbi:hypothetical protein B5X24_HaOG213485 [Helicoverpa armigera]|uniref:Uncharacterized protein n=1 Tax=Helicoverpa armigera TaxID=29058 RepID=A0A2W1B541_HELAM|nr:hypothetical protein B5X24_HaOG213485 [Helicoverpa armigera]